MAGLADAGQDVVGGAAQPDADPGGRPSTDVELDSFGLVVGRQTLVADSVTGLSSPETKDKALRYRTLGRGAQALGCNDR